MLYTINIVYGSCCAYSIVYRLVSFVNVNSDKICCFWGHRKIGDSPDLRSKIFGIVESLIVNENIDTFLFGSKSEFNSLCYELVTKIKEKYPNIKRVYVRAEYADITDSYEKYLLEGYEETYFPNNVRNAGRVSYVIRNQEMIKNSCVCVIYYDKNYVPKSRENSHRNFTDYQRKSGTKIAYEYATKEKVRIINTL